MNEFDRSKISMHNIHFIATVSLYPGFSVLTRRLSTRIKKSLLPLKTQKRFLHLVLLLSFSVGLDNLESKEHDLEEIVPQKQASHQ